MSLSATSSLQGQTRRLKTIDRKSPPLIFCNSASAFGTRHDRLSGKKRFLSFTFSVIFSTVWVQSAPTWRLLKRIREGAGQMEQANSSGTLKSSEMRSGAFCIVSTQAGLTQGSERRAVAVISPPSGRLGRDGSHNSAAGSMDLRVGVFLCFWQSTSGHFSCPSLHTSSRWHNSVVGSVFSVLTQLPPEASHQTFEALMLRMKQSLGPQAEAEVPTVGVKGFYLPKNDGNYQLNITRWTRKRSYKNNPKRLDELGTNPKTQGRSKIHQETHRKAQRRRLETSVLAEEPWGTWP